jgi:hypothetical protein
MDNQLQTIVQTSGLDQTKAEYILTQFQDYFKIASEWEIKAKAIIVTNETQIADMQMARVGRLFLKDKRIAIEKARKSLKEQALREGKAIDGIANVLKALIEPIEEYLDRQERFVEIKAAEKAERERIEAEKKAEEERIAKEKAEAEEHERIRLENERLRAEAIEREKIVKEEKDILEAEKRAIEDQARKEKESAERKAKAEKEKNDKLIAEQKAITEKAEQEAKEREKKIKEQALKEVERVKKQMEKKMEKEIECPYCHKKFSPEVIK